MRFPPHPTPRHATPRGQGETDSQFERGHAAHKWDDHTSVSYMKYKGVAIVASRDFANLTHWRVDQDGNVLIVATSIDHPTVPLLDGVVRAHLDIGGWFIRPRPGAEALRRKYGADIAAGRRPLPHADPEVDAEGCDCTYFMRTDFKGSIPGFVQKQVAAQQAMIVAKLRTALQTRYGPGGNPGPAALAEMRKTALVNLPEAAAWLQGFAAAAERKARREAARVIAPPAAAAPSNGAGAAVSAPAPPPPPAFPPFHPAGTVGPADRDALAAKLAMLQRYATATEGLWRPNGVSNGVTCWAPLDDMPSARGDGFVPYPRRAIVDLLINLERKVRGAGGCG
jgi:hypothetical protein